MGGEVKIRYNQRADGRTEAICEHGVGHTVAVPQGMKAARAWWVHGCDGCCAKPEFQEIVEKRFPYGEVTNENIPSLDTVARALATSGESQFQLSVALAKAQARIAELEAQAAALAKAADDYLHQRLGHGPKDVGEAAQRLDDALANLHISQTAPNARSWAKDVLVAYRAYRAAGGEG